MNPVVNTQTNVGFLNRGSSISNLAGNPPQQSTVKVKCLPSQQSPSTCVREPKMVCAYIGGVPREFKNVCDACIENKTEAYTVGRCPPQNISVELSGISPKKCIRPRPLVFSCTLKQEPVCGIVTTGITKTFLN